ncbi:hypothetical protein HKD37_07G018608 [Glycine soja]
MEKWNLGTKPGQRLIWVQCWGIPLIAWDTEQIRKIVAAIGELVELDDDIKEFRRSDNHPRSRQTRCNTGSSDEIESEDSDSGSLRSSIRDAADDDHAPPCTDYNQTGDGLGARDKEHDPLPRGSPYEPLGNNLGRWSVSNTVEDGTYDQSRADMESGLDNDNYMQSINAQVNIGPCGPALDISNESHALHIGSTENSNLCGNLNKDIANDHTVGANGPLLLGLTTHTTENEHPSSPNTIKAEATTPVSRKVYSKSTWRKKQQACHQPNEQAEHSDKDQTELGLVTNNILNTGSLTPMSAASTFIVGTSNTLQEAKHLWNMAKQMGVTCSTDHESFINTISAMELRDRKEAEKLGNRKEMKKQHIEIKLCQSMWGDTDVTWEILLATNTTGGLLCLWSEKSFNVERRLKDLNPRGLWCLLGDFNSVRNASERVGVSQRGGGGGDPLINEFNDWLDDVEVLEPPCIGSKYTWYRPNGTARSKLDRVFISSDWLSKWPASTQHILDKNFSDHCPMLVKSKNADWGPKPFRLLDCWLKDKSFGKVVKDSWTQTQQTGWSGYVLKEKIKCLKERIKLWNKEQNGDLQEVSKHRS